VFVNQNCKLQGDAKMNAIWKRGLANDPESTITMLPCEELLWLRWMAHCCLLDDRCKTQWNRTKLLHLGIVPPAGLNRAIRLLRCCSQPPNDDVTSDRIDNAARTVSIRFVNAWVPVNEKNHVDESHEWFTSTLNFRAIEICDCTLWPPMSCLSVIWVQLILCVSQTQSPLFCFWHESISLSVKSCVALSAFLKSSGGKQICAACCDMHATYQFWLCVGIKETPQWSGSAKDSWQQMPFTSDPDIAQVVRRTCEW